MHSLHSRQSAFCAAMFGDSESALLPMLVEPPEVARRRLAAYRHSIFGNLSAALRCTYPVAERIVGTPFFMEAARQFVRAVASASGDLNEFGETFGNFLAEYPHASHLEYLPDVARMEWLVQKVFYASEAPPADLTILTRTHPDRYGDLCFAAAPGYARIDSPWPLADIWRVNQADFDGDMAVDFSQGAHVLVLRCQGLLHVEALGAGEARLLDVLATHQPLSAATARAMAVEPDFDLAAALNSFVSRGLLWPAQLANGAAAATEPLDP